MDQTDREDTDTADTEEGLETTRLLSWYERRRRDLPWRRTRDPYRIWVSEVMLQQTRVATALPYYERFLERFPDVHELAAAETDEILASWSGLGYYRRARQMHAAARQVAEDGGDFPTDSSGLRELPGIGPYTAAAIASICFDEPIAVLDGNVERVIARRQALAENPKRAATRRKLRAAAAELLDPERPGDSNQALMELGATVCTPRTPDCAACPVSDGCRGRDDPRAYPAPKTKRATVEVHRVVAVAESEEGLLLYRRADDEKLMAGLWELPTVELDEGETATIPSIASVAARLGERYGGLWSLGAEIGRARHGITHRSITLRIHRAEVEAGGVLAEGPEAARVRRDELSEYATSSMVEKVLRQLSQGELPLGS